MSKSASLVRVGIAYVVAVAVGAAWLLLGPDTAHLWLDALIADTLATLVIFGFSRAHHNSSFYDAWWSVRHLCWRSTGGRPGRSGSTTSGAGWSSA